MGGSSRSVIWIVGDSYIARAHQRLQIYPPGTLLSFLPTQVVIQWFGVGGMRWEQVLLKFAAQMRIAMPPDILVVHCGGNDLGRVSQRELIRVMRCDLERIMQLAPNVKIVFSEMVSRIHWRFVNTWEAIERSRKVINKQSAGIVRKMGGFNVRHKYVVTGDPGYYLKDGVHLSQVGLDIFVLGLQDGIERVLGECVGGARPA
ncbi:uncharacterized protein LOC121400543 [Xenopus laevis]|uniref:1-alkyl-2-acetylglycerophosphocholine esterase n=1 Tax=Xenopus laevis TaxID=8355 RepID=A0A8J1MEJ7_XENLA|nr:uncharacterized protein LOC121400543 [Xenopus laevis]